MSGQRSASDASGVSPLFHPTHRSPPSRVRFRSHVPADAPGPVSSRRARPPDPRPAAQPAARRRGRASGRHDASASREAAKRRRSAPQPAAPPALRARREPACRPRGRDDVPAPPVAQPIGAGGRRQRPTGLPVPATLRAARAVCACARCGRGGVATANAPRASGDRAARRSRCPAAGSPLVRSCSPPAARR